MSSAVLRPLVTKFSNCLRSGTASLIGPKLSQVDDGLLIKKEYEDNINAVRTLTTVTASEKEKMCKQFLGKPTSKYKPCTHVIFDLDGTILNTEDISFDAAEKYLCRVFKKKLTMELFGSTMGSLSHDAASTIIRELGLPISPDVYLHGVWQELRGSLLESQELPGVDYLVCHFDRCKVPMGLATSSSKQTFDLKTKHHKRLFKKFCPIVLGGSEPKLKRGKPHPDIFLLTAQKFAEEPEKAEQVLVIEDSLNGVRAAKAAGMQVVMVPSPCLPRHLIELAQPTLLLNSLHEFNPKLFELPGYPGQQEK